MKSIVFAFVAQVVLAVSLFAQAPVQAPAAVPVLDALDKQAIELEAEAAQAANSACQALESVKHYQKSQAFVNAQIKAKYPGYVLNRQTRRLEVPAPAAK